MNYDQMSPQEVKRHKAQNMRYKKAALDSLSYEAVESELEEMSRVCEDIHYAFYEEADESLLNALDGDTEEEMEFKIAFSDLENKVEQLQEALHEAVHQGGYEGYDDCTVALIGKNQRLVGYDSYEDDFFKLCSYEEEFAVTEASKRLMRLTKTEMLKSIGQCMRVLVGFLSVRQEFDYLNAALEVLRGENVAVLKAMKQVDELYEQADQVQFRRGVYATEELDRVLAKLPERFWVE